MADNIKPLKTPATPVSEFETIPAGVYVARCYKMIDLGTQTTESKRYGTKVDRKIMLYWELLTDDDGKDVFMEDGKRRFSISQEYTWSMHKKANLRAALDAWRGEPFTDDQANGFEITKLLGTYCKIQVVHNKSGDRTFANVGSIMATNKRPDGVNDLVSFSITDPDMEVFENLPEWIQNKITAAPEWESDVPTEQAGKITDEGNIEIEDLDKKDKPEGVPTENVKKLQF